MQSVWDLPSLPSLPSQIILHVLPSRHHARRRRRNIAGISYRPSVASAAAMSFPLWSPYGSNSLALKSPVTSSSAPQGCSLSVATTLFIIEVLLGES